MPTLAESIRGDLTAAVRAGDGLRRDTLRLLIAALDNARIAAGRDLADEDAHAVLQREAKQRRESIGEYRAGGRDDLADRERDELAIVEAYLPDQLGEDELRAIAREVVAATGASGPGDLGAVMGPLMQRVRGRADGRQANAIVRELLAGG